MTDRGWFSDMVRNYLGFFLGLWLALSPAWAAEVLVGDLTVSYLPPWERALATEEDSENSAILRWQDSWASMTVFLPHHQIELKSDEGRFYRQLEQQWRALYGADARVYPMELGGTRWRVCRRPSLNGDATVFQLVTVNEGRAHHLLVVAPGRMQILPDAAEHLIASAAWGGVRSVVFTRNSDEALSLQHVLPIPAPVASPPEATEAAAPVLAETATSAAAAADRPQPQTEAPPAAMPAPVALEALPTAHVSVPAAPNPVAAASSPIVAGPSPIVATPAPTPTRTEPTEADAGNPWQLVRVVHSVPKGPGLAALAKSEADRLGERTVLSGYGLTRQEDGIKGFVEGYVWQENAGKRPVRKEFSRRWQTQWQAPTELRPGEQGWSVNLIENSLEGEAGLVAGMNVRLELMALCGPRDDLVAAFDALEKAGPGSAERLAKLSCPPLAGLAPAVALSLPAGTLGAQSMRLSVPAAWAAQETGREGVVKRLVVTLTYPPAGPEPGLGDALLAGARSYYIYLPQE